MRSSTAYLSLGCNLGDCAANLAAAVNKLNEEPDIEVTRVSSVYVTEPVSNLRQPDFLNIAAGLKTTLQPFDLLHACQRIERELGGREGRVPLGPRTIDLDILLYEQVEISHKELELPHPRLLERAFMLAPLAEIAPEAVLPGGGSVGDALAALSDQSRVEKKGPLPL
ncbi:MAG: 2-amino-4-hydroxy-6-hydroxymethyldihydropteridine diphosphokinase [Thermoleophilia bacterium]|nr:2-amino-4-hydroxy-6-hydroxymethyldihydropteridine diphosphokinase [Thermoleophilia bacterium]